MEIRFRTSRLATLLNSERNFTREYGPRRARAIRARLLTLEAAETLSQVSTAPPERRHQLTQNRNEQYAIRIDGQYRLVFVPDHDPIPRRPDGGIDTDLVTAILITEVIDYH